MEVSHFDYIFRKMVNRGLSTPPEFLFIYIHVRLKITAY